MILVMEGESLVTPWPSAQRTKKRPPAATVKFPEVLLARNEETISQRAIVARSNTYSTVEVMRDGNVMIR